MKKILAILVCGLLLAGCSGAPAPAGGLIWTNVSAPIAATDNPNKPTLVGRAEATSILGLIATGDASIRAAVRNGGITQIHHVDYHKQSIFGVVTTFTTIVYGN